MLVELSVVEQRYQAVLAVGSRSRRWPGALASRARRCTGGSADMRTNASPGAWIAPTVRRVARTRWVPRSRSGWWRPAGATPTGFSPTRPRGSEGVARALPYPGCLEKAPMTGAELRKEIIRCLKRLNAREVYGDLEAELEALHST